MKNRRLTVIMWTVLLSAGVGFPATAGDSRVLLIPLSAVDGAGADELQTWNDAIRETVVTQDAITFSLVEAQPGCTDSCAFTAAKSKAASSALWVQVSKRGKSWAIVAKLFDTGSDALLGMSQKTAPGKGAVGDALRAAVSEVLSRAPVSVGRGDANATNVAPIAAPALLYVEFEIHAHGKKISDGSTVTVKAPVFINGKKVGVTPYKDALSAGRYEVQVHGYGKKYAQWIVLTPGKGNVFAANMEVPLTKEEEAAEKARLDAARRKAEQEDMLMFQEEYAKWEKSHAAIKEKRKPLAIAGGILLPAGIGMTIAGAVTLAKADNYEQDLSVLKDQYYYETDPDQIAYLSELISETDQDRKSNLIAGSILLPVGIVSTISGIVVLALLKKYPYPPEPEFSGKVSESRQLSVSPILGSDLAGVSVRGRF